MAYPSLTSQNIASFKGKNPEVEFEIKEEFPYVPNFGVSYEISLRNVPSSSLLNRSLSASLLMNSGRNMTSGDTATVVFFNLDSTPQILWVSHREGIPKSLAIGGFSVNFFTGLKGLSVKKDKADSREQLGQLESEVDGFIEKEFLSSQLVHVRTLLFGESGFSFKPSSPKIYQPYGCMPGSVVSATYQSGGTIPDIDLSLITGSLDHISTLTMSLDVGNQIFRIGNFIIPDVGLKAVLVRSMNSKELITPILTPSLDSFSADDVCLHLKFLTWIQSSTLRSFATEWTQSALMAGSMQSEDMSIDFDAVASFFGGLDSDKRGRLPRATTLGSIRGFMICASVSSLLKIPVSPTLMAGLQSAIAYACAYFYQPGANYSSTLRILSSKGEFILGLKSFKNTCKNDAKTRLVVCHAIKSGSEYIPIDLPANGFERDFVVLTCG